MTIAFKNIAVTAVALKPDSTTITINYANDFAIGDAIFVMVAMDNSGASGASPAPSMVDYQGNVYTKLKEQNHTAGSVANDGSYVAIFGCILTTAVTATNAITVTTTTVSGVCVAAAVGFTGVTSLTLVSSNSSSGTSGTYSSGATGSVAIGNLVLGATACEGASLPSADTDTTNGAWTSYSADGGGAGGSQKQGGLLARKITSGATGTQTFNGTNTSATDWAAVIIEISAVIDPQTCSIMPITMPLTSVALTASVGAVNRSITPVTMSLTPVALTKSVDSVTINVSPVDGADDGSTNVPGSGDFSNSAPSLIVGWDFTARSSWMRFSGIDIPAGSTILSAYLRVNLYAANGAGSLTKIFAEKSASPSNPTSNANYAAKTVTTAVVDWVAPSGTSGFASSPDISSVIQELVDTYGSLSEVVILHKNDEPSNASRNMRYSSSDDPFGIPPELVVLYGVVSDDVATDINPIVMTLHPEPLGHTLGAVHADISPVLMALTLDPLEAVTGGKPFVWNGSGWVKKPVKVWDGSDWVVKPVKIWTGSVWDPV